MKKGDKVICIDNSNFEDILEVGEIYRVLKKAKYDSPALSIQIHKTENSTITSSKYFLKRRFSYINKVETRT